MPRRNKRFIIATALLTVLLVGGGLQVAARLRQNQLDDALVAAVQRVDAPAVHRLLAAGANARTTVTAGRSVGDLLRQLFWREQVQPGSVDCLALILTDGSVLQPATAGAADSIAADLVSHGADVETDLRNYGKPLNVASIVNLHQTVDALLAHHADVNARDGISNTPLFSADDFTTERLLDAGADPNGECWNKSTPLCNTRTKRKALLLIEHGASVNHVGARMSVIDWIRSRPGADPVGLLKLLRAHGALTYAELQAHAQHGTKR